MKSIALLTVAVSFSAVACATPAASDDSASQGADLVQLGQLTALETKLELVHDDNRVRSEEVLKAGPCYQKMAAGKGTWDLRRYTKGAAFFETDKDGEPKDTVACLDLDIDRVTAPNMGTETTMFEGFALDVLNRFPTGAPKQIAHDSTSPFGSADGVELDSATLYFDSDHQFLGIVGARIPERTNPRVMRELAFTAYKLAEKGVNIGAFEGPAPGSAGAGYLDKLSVRFGNVTITYTLAAAGVGSTNEKITATTDEGSAVAKCSRFVAVVPTQPSTDWCPQND